MHRETVTNIQGEIESLVLKDRGLEIGIKGKRTFQDGNDGTSYEESEGVHQAFFKYPKKLKGSVLLNVLKEGTKINYNENSQQGTFPQQGEDGEYTINKYRINFLEEKHKWLTLESEERTPAI